MNVIINKIDQSYIRWIWHGESARRDKSIILKDRICDKRDKVDYSEGDQLKENFSILSIH